MWSVVVEVHLPDGAGTLFQVGEWVNQEKAYNFARDLEWKLGEHKITAHVVYSSTLFKKWLDKMTQSRIRVKPNRRITNLPFPPCDDDEWEEQ